MNWLKIAAVIIGALIAFYIVGSVIHIITALLGVIVVLAILGAGGYVAYKVVTSRKSRALRDRPRRDRGPARDRELSTTTGSRIRPAAPASPRQRG